MGSWIPYIPSLPNTSWVDVWTPLHTSWESLTWGSFHTSSKGMTGGFWKTRVYNPTNQGPFISGSTISRFGSTHPQTNGRPNHLGFKAQRWKICRICGSGWSPQIISTNRMENNKSIWWLDTIEKKHIHYIVSLKSTKNYDLILINYTYKYIIQPQDKLGWNRENLSQKPMI